MWSSATLSGAPRGGGFFFLGSYDGLCVSLLVPMLAAIGELIRAAESYVDSPEIPWKRLIVTLLWSVYLFETYVAWRQYQLYSLTTPPAALEKHVSMDDFHKSQRYGRDKMRFSLVSDAVMHVVNVLGVVYNLTAHTWAWSEELLGVLRVPRTEPTLSAANLVVGLALQMPVGFVLGAYRNFVIEERHGFNKQTWHTFCLDHVKQFALSIVFGMPIMALVITVIRWAGDAFVVYTVLLFTALILCGTVIYPTVIQPLFNKLTPMPEGILRDRVTALASSLNFPLKHLFVIDGSKRSGHSNAYFYGVIPGGSKHIVIFDTLMEQSTPAEIEAVLAHELGHWMYSHPSKLLVIGLTHMAVTLSLFTLFINNASLFRAFGFGRDAGAIAHVTYLPVAVGFELFNLILHPVDALVQFGMNALTRHFEYAADRFAALMPRPAKTAAECAAAELVRTGTQGAAGAAGAAPADVSAVVQAWKEHLATSPTDDATYPDLLKQALIKLQVHNLSTMHHDALFSAYHHSHPTLPERIAAIDQVANTKKVQ